VNTEPEKDSNGEEEFKQVLNGRIIVVMTVRTQVKE
jgi:hypothetical protein